MPKAGASAVELEELRLARKAAEARVVELEATLTAARSELAKLRGRYAELYLQNRESGRRLEQLELQAAHLVLDGQELGAGEVEAEALRALESMREAQVALVAEAQALQVYLASALDVLGPSEVMRREISARCAQLVGAAQRTLKPLSTVAGRGRRDLDARSSRVLAVNDDLQVVVLDRGSVDGVRRGTVWQVVRDERVVARLRIIEVRADISAAVVTEGRLADVGPGSVVTPDRS